MIKWLSQKLKHYFLNIIMMSTTKVLQWKKKCQSCLLQSCTKYIYIGHILTNTGKYIQREYYNKNWHHYDRRFPFRQVFKLEQHYGSYCDITAIQGQRMGRLMEIIRSTDTNRLRQILCEKLFEYTTGLGDPPSFTIRLLRRLLRTSANNSDQSDIILEIINVYKSFTKYKR